MIKALIDQDYSIWFDEEIQPGTNLSECISDHIDNCTRKGFFVCTITDQYIDSENCIDELYYASEKGAQIIPVILGDTQIPDRIQSFINPYKSVFVNAETLNYTLVVDTLNFEVKSMLF